jgi:thymidine phosphorylase
LSLSGGSVVAGFFMAHFQALRNSGGSIFKKVLSLQPEGPCNMALEINDLACLYVHTLYAQFSPLATKLDFQNHPDSRFRLDYQVHSDDQIFGQICALHRTSSDEEVIGVIRTIARRCPADADVAASLAQILAGTGGRVAIEHPLIADVASTGGPSSLSTLLAPLFLREGGAIVPKLGVPGRPAGGIDCLAQIPGYNSILTPEEVKTVLASGGYAHFLATGEMAPLDGRMFRLRQDCGAQAVPTLVAASLLSKKVAVGIKYAGLDIRVATHGNFGTDMPSARANGKLFIQAASRLGIHASSLLTDARFANQPYLGRRESLLALHILFTETQEAWLQDHFELCRVLAISTMAGKCNESVSSCRSSDIAKHFFQNLVDQGATVQAFESVVNETAALHTTLLKAPCDGFASFPLQSLRDAMVAWQASSAPANNFPDPVGMCLTVKPGTWVSEGDTIATIRVPDSLREGVLQKLEGICEPQVSPCGPSIEGVTAIE